MVYIFQQSANGDQSIKSISEGVKKLFGITPHQAYEKASTLFEQIHPDDINDVNQSIIKSFENNTNWSNQFRIIVTNKVKWIQGRSTIQKFPDNSAIWKGVCIDITKEKQLDDVYNIIVDHKTIHVLQLFEHYTHLHLARESACHGLICVHNGAYALRIFASEHVKKKTSAKKKQ